MLLDQEPLQLYEAVGGHSCCTGSDGVHLQANTHVPWCR